MEKLDRRTLLTALVGACAAAATFGIGAAQVQALPLPRNTAPDSKPTDADDLAAAADDMPGQDRVQAEKAQYIIVRRRRYWRRRRFYRRYY